MPSALLDHASKLFTPVIDALAGEERVWIVGGAVRDLLLGREPRELDLVVEGDAHAVARRAAERLGGGVLLHERFGTATVRAPGATFDLAAARRESYAHPGALPDVAPGATLEEDLARRDFTVNALALRLADGATAGWPGARDDLEAGLLRVLHDASLRDDPTRLLRLARYAARLGFAAEPHTARLAAAAVAEGALGTVSGERLGAELRLLACEPMPDALVALARWGVGAALLPGFAVHAPLLERALALRPPDARADMIALGSALGGRPASVADGPDRLRAALDRLAFPATERDVLLACAELPRVAAALAGATLPSEVRRVLRREPVEVAVLAAAQDGRARRWLDEWRHVRPAITGHDLAAAGLEGPAVGAGLEAAIEAQLDGRAATRDEQLAAALSAA